MTGEIAILNVGSGDTKLSFDPKNKAEAKRAGAAVKDMLKRGFCILVEAGKDERGPLYRRVTEFDAETAEYIIAGAPEDFEGLPSAQRPKEPSGPAPRRRGRKEATTRRVPAAQAKAISVARISGG